MKKNNKNKKIILFNTLVLLGMIVLSCLAELFIFNFNYFTMSKDERAIIDIDNNDLIIEGEYRDEENKIIISKDAQIRFKKDVFIKDIKIQAAGEPINYRLIANINGKNSKEYKLIRNSSILSINGNSKDVVLNINNVSDSDLIIEGFELDNTFAFNIFRFGFMVACMIIIFYLVYYRDFAKKNIHISFLIISLCIGISVSLLSPTFFCFDEKEHFIKAYQISEFNLENNVDKNQNWVYNSEEFLQFNAIEPFNSYKERMHYMRQFSSREYNLNANYNTTASTYVPTPYIQSSIGVAIGKALHLPFILTFYLGRIFNTITYSLLGCLLINKAKICKKLLFVILSLPAFVYSSGFYTADTITILSSTALFVIFINMLASKEHEIGYKKIALFIITLVISVTSKISAAPLCLLFVAIPKEKFKENVKVLFSKLSVMFISAITMLFTFWYASQSTLNQWAIEGADTKQQIIYILHNPIKYTILMIKTTLNSFWDYVVGVTVNLAYVESFSSFFALFLIILIVLVSVCDNETDILFINLKNKIVILMSILLGFAIVITALYGTFNPVGSQTILGVQGRYLSPMLFGIMILFKNKKIKNEFNIDKVNYFIQLLMSAILVMMLIKLLIYNI